MKRRHFLTASFGTAAFLATGQVGCKKANDTLSEQDRSVTDGGKLAGLTLPQLRDQYRYDLFEDFLPFMEKHIIDHEYGGFMCNADRDGTLISTDKNSWYEGRGIWAYAFLYNNLAKKEKYLDVARKSVEFILKNQPPGDQLWPRLLSRNGEPKSPPATQIYGDLFIAEGLAEYYKATGEKTYWDLARQILNKCIGIYDREDYVPDIGRTYLGPNAQPFHGARVLGVWMVLIRIVTQMLDMQPDHELESLANRCVDAVLNWHYNPEYDLINELINHDLSRPDNEYAQLVYTGHAIETLWMLLYEAARRRDKKLFEKTARLFRRHVEVAWDDVYGGVFRNLKNVDKNIWSLDKALWAQEEVLIGSLFAIEHTGARWAKDWFARMYAHVREKFPLKQYGFPLWILYADRKVTFQRKYHRIGNYHHPRHLMLNLLSIERMIKRDGNVSQLFA